MKFFPAGISFLAVIAFHSVSCTTIRELPYSASHELQEEHSNAEYDAGRKLLESFLCDDAEGFCSMLPPELQADFNEEKFRLARQVIQKSLGEPVSFQFLTVLEHVSIRPYLWKVRFLRKMKTGEEVGMEALFRVLAGSSKEGGALIVGFNFM